LNIVQALTDPSILGYAFAGNSWRAWRTILTGAFGLPLSAADSATFNRLTGRNPLAQIVRELWVIAGRRGGKSNIAAAVAIYLATLKRWTLSSGETGTIMVLAVDRDQARVAFRYCLGLLEASPILSAEVESTTADTIRLRNGIEIVIATSDKASVRGRTLVAVIADEIAFWGTDAEEVLRAIRPGMASQPQAMLVAISTAYSQRGPLFDAFKRSYANDDPRVLVVRATTRDLNDQISQAFIDDELARDPQAAAAEYLAEFRSDLEALFDAALIDSATRSAPRELPRLLNTPSGTPIQYFAAVDISGGRRDATTAAIAHRDGERIRINAARRWASPHDPVAVAREVAALLANYGLRYAVADQYGAELSKSIYAEAGVQLIAAEVTRSEAYLHALPLFTSGRIEIPDEPVLRQELLALERRVGRSGRDAVDHPPGSHDDLANSVALAAWAANRHPVSTESQVVVVHSTVNDGLMESFDDAGGKLPLAQGLDRMLNNWDKWS
jgi:hypothetical protein